MAQRTWKLGLGLGLLGFALASGCVVKSGDSDDDGSAGQAGEGGSSTTGGSSGSGKGGSSGSNTGGSATGGSSGSATGGSSGSDTGGTSTGGASGSNTGGTSGTMDTDPECDPIENTPYPNCNPTDAENACEVCIQANCCEESMECYGYNPGNVCGWGGPDNEGEIACYVACASEYVIDNGVYDDGAIDECTAACTTDGCGQIGNATQDLVVCIQDNCEDDCWPAP